VKKTLLIAAGTVTGLGAVLSITPPALSESVGSVGLTGGTDLGGDTAAPAQSADATADATATQTPTPTPTPTASATASATAKATATPTPSKTSASATPTPSASATPTPTPTATKSAAPAGKSGTFTGSSYAARNYGSVSVTATFSNGVLTSVSATQSPMSWAQQAFSVLVPWVNAGNITVEQVKQYSSAQLPCSTSNSCNSRASYTAEAFWASLKSAITKAGL
jgi:hypothetical protein